MKRQKTLLSPGGWTALLLLLAAEILEFQQKRGQQHFAHGIRLRGGFFLQSQQLLQ